MTRDTKLHLAFTVHDAAELPNILHEAREHGFVSEPGSSDPQVAWGTGTTRTLDALWLLTGVASVERRLPKAA